MDRKKQDPFETLVIFPRLEIGPVRIEPRRLRAAYTIVHSDSSETIDLTYRYEEDVFETDDPSALNLAGMITAQVSFNYGLFCREIVFHGLFDGEDQRFIRDMMTNTAREIYIKKFLEPNSFLTGEAARLPLVKHSDFLLSKIRFSGGRTPSRAKKSLPPRFSAWEINPDGHAVLSSGGKDSLLSFGLLREIGAEVHPIFINESGRHWYTALNAFRDFKRRVPETARVWTNSDRVFVWMLRHLPFIRKDFARLRSDEYPIRLWTVAVFLFGALPLLKKRRLGRLVIGDEYDTTNRMSHQGITHYNGLYDQSLYFDNALTRYFLAKGWNVRQFSLLRPLSELLIEKVLAERYPDLQQNQMSCHAAHITATRVKPCGECEKCRRIVGMLKVIGADPTRCGYTETQIARCLEEISRRGVHQESAGAEHLNFLLKEKGLVQTFAQGHRVQAHPEIMKLRFDPERSPLDGVPADLSLPVFKILAKHADGAVLRRGRKWVDFDVFQSFALQTPSAFKQPSNPKKSSDRLHNPKKPNRHAEAERSAGRPSKPAEPHLWGHLTWPEAQDRFKDVDTALLPVGSTEQHGPHLPLDTDAFDADYLARQVAGTCSDPKPLVLPCIPYGVSYHHEDFAGTLSITPRTLTRLVFEVGMSAARHGITKLVIINGHGGNIPALQFAAQMINREARIFTCVETGETSEKDVQAIAETPNDVHAGEIETSTSLAVRPELVRRDKARKFVPRFSSRYLDFTSKRSVEWYARIARLSSTGVLGDPTKASREKGEKIWEVMIKHLAEFVEGIKDMSLDEIFHRRY